MPRSQANDDLVNKSCWTKFNLVCWNCTKLHYSPTGICVFVQCLLNVTENLPIGNKAPQNKSSMSFRNETGAFILVGLSLSTLVFFVIREFHQRHTRNKVTDADTKLSKLGKFQSKPFMRSILRDFQRFYEIRHNNY